MKKGLNFAILDNCNLSVRTWTKAICLSIGQNTDQLSPFLRRKISGTVICRLHTTIDT